VKPTKRKRETKKFPQSWGNLALADESLGVLQETKAESPSPVLRLVRSSTEKDVEADALAPAIGIINGIRLSITLWLLIILCFLLIR